MSREYTDSEIGEPDRTTTVTSDGTEVSIGDEVVIARVYFDDDEKDLHTITDETRAIYLGEFMVTCDGEALFDGEPIPLLSTTLDDGKIVHIWGFECDWLPVDDFRAGAVVLAEIVSAEIDSFEIS